MDLINTLLDFIFTEPFYILIGKITTFIFLFGVLKGIHKHIYKRVYWYSNFTDKLLLPYHWYKIMFVMGKAQVINFYKVLSVESKLNDTLYEFRGYLIKRLLRDGYSETEIENFHIEYKNSLK